MSVINITSYNVSEALVIRIDLAVITKEVMSPCLLGMNYDSEFKIG